jgi:PAS domain S-box-containing protein
MIHAKKIRVLIVEDNFVDVLWVQAELAQIKTLVFEITHVKNLAEALDRLDCETFDVVLLDLGLPDSHGLETFLEVHRSCPEIPVVVASGLDDEALAIEAVRSGAQDYLVKDKWDGFRLSCGIAYAIERQRLLLQLKHTERSLRQSEEIARRTTRALKTITDCNHVLIHANDESAFLHDICRLLVDIGGYRMAWIGFALQDEKKLIQPVAVAGFEEGYLDSVRITWADDEAGRGPTGTAIRTGTCGINRNSAQNQEFRLWRSEAMKRGYASSIALPLIVGGVTIGALMIYASDPDAFDEEEVELLMQLAADLGYGINTLRMRAEKERADIALRESEQRFRAIFEGAQDCIVLKDRSLKYTLVNPAAERLYGQPASKIIGLTYEQLFGPEGAAYVREVDTRVLGGESLEEEHTRRLRGTPITFLETRLPLRDSEGEITGILVVARDITERKRTEIVVPEMTAEYPSKAMRLTLAMARIAAQKESTILLLGESGSGKDYLARFLHRHSKRADGPFFSINCAAVAPELAESELFGHEKGAFTGAYGRKRGLFELAEGGTLLLNEIGELSPPVQAKLLTFLDTRKFTRVGGEKEITVNARLITATNRDLAKEVGAGNFRNDLFYRINVLAITVPPLRERLEDIPILAQQIVSELQRELRVPISPVLDFETVECLKGYSWPGNVREFRNALERALILSDGESLTLDLPSVSGARGDCLCEVRFSPDRSLHEATDEVIRALCVEALKFCRGNKKQTAQILGISRDSLYRYLKKFGMEAED